MNKQYEVRYYAGYGYVVYDTVNKYTIHQCQPPYKTKALAQKECDYQNKYEQWTL